MPRVGDVLGAAVAAQVVDVQAELARDLGLDHLDGHGVLVGLGDDVLERLLGDARASTSTPRIEAKLTDAGERAVELADVGRDAAGDPLEHLGLGDLEALPLDLLAQDGDARLEVGAADVDDDALAEARAQALLELLELARRPVGGDDDLLAGLVERVERVEELDLGLLLLGEELDVVDEQDVVRRGTSA